MDDFHQILEHMRKTKPGGVLATIIQVTGSAYRKAGTSMLFTEEGPLLGMLSPGCLESDLPGKISEIRDRGETRILEYDLRAEDDLGWGRGTGCGGVIKVLIEPVNDQRHEHFMQVKECLDRRHPVVHVRQIRQEASGGSLFFPVCPNKPVFGEWRDERPPASWAAALAGEAKRLPGDAGHVPLPDGSGPVFVRIYRPKPRLFLFGAGPDARPLAALADRLGFAVAVCDWRPALCSREHFPAGAALSVGFPAELAARLDADAGDSAVILSHDFARDRELLEALLRRPWRYLGAVGPRRRTVRLLGGAEPPERLRSPAGLPIGAQGPEEIAVSIAAELIRAYRQPGDAT